MNLVIIPTYNEKNNIEALLHAVYTTLPDIHVLIVDDHSPDQTGELVSRLISQDYPEQLHLLQRTGKLGLGTAYIAGFHWALQRSYDYIFEMDADFSHNPKYLAEFVKVMATSDVVLGSRYIDGGGVTNWGLLRRLISRGGSLYSRTILRLPYRDLTGGFKCFRREVLAAIDLDAVKSNGYSFQVEMTYRAHLMGFRITEVPIVFEERAAGQSKMSRDIFWEAVLMIVKLRLALGSGGEKR
jgi:dolichol-phosphate mannosyltransferase